MRERLPANFGKPWTPEEDAIVAAAYDAGAPLVQIARKQMRTQSSVRNAPGKAREDRGAHMNIVTEYDPKPIVTPEWDWSAIDQDTYDGAEECNCPIGRGKTEREAINDLVEQLLDRG